MSVGLFDAIIRTFYRVCEFTDDPACVLRVGLSPARAPVSLSDGTRVEIGGLVGTLHFGISICHALSPADPTPLGLRSAKPGPAFASCAGLLCRERTRFAADTGASRRGRTVSPARDIAGATRSDLLVLIVFPGNSIATEKSCKFAAFFMMFSRVGLSSHCFSTCTSVWGTEGA